MKLVCGEAALRPTLTLHALIHSRGWASSTAQPTQGTPAKQHTGVWQKQLNQVQLLLHNILWQGTALANQIHAFLVNYFVTYFYH